MTVFLPDLVSDIPSVMIDQNRPDRINQRKLFLARRAVRVIKLICSLS